MKALLAPAVASLLSWVVSSASAQNGNMNGGMGWGSWMGGYGGLWGPIVLVVAVGLVAWIVMQKRK